MRSNKWKMIITHVRFITHARVQISNGIVVVHRESIKSRKKKNEDDRKVERVQRHFNETRNPACGSSVPCPPLLNRQAGNKDR